MSDYENHFAKFRKVPKGQIEGWGDVTLDEQLKEIWEQNGYDIDDYSSEEFFNELYEKFIVVNDELWEIFDHDKSDAKKETRITANGDGSFTIATRFYNGGTYFEEILEDEIKKLKE